jgi:hypothetical protein
MATRKSTKTATAPTTRMVSYQPPGLRAGAARESLLGAATKAVMAWTLARSRRAATPWRDRACPQGRDSRVDFPAPTTRLCNDNRADPRA